MCRKQCLNEHKLRLYILKSYLLLSLSNFVGQKKWNTLVIKSSDTQKCVFYNLLKRQKTYFLEKIRELNLDMQIFNNFNIQVILVQFSINSGRDYDLRYIFYYLKKIFVENSFFAKKNIRSNFFNKIIKHAQREYF